MAHELAHAEKIEHSARRADLGISIKSRRVLLFQSGDGGVFQYLAASDGYYAYWLSEDPSRREDCIVHFCRSKRTKCPAKLGREFTHISRWRRLQLEDATAPGYVPGYARAVARQMLQKAKEDAFLCPIVMCSVNHMRVFARQMTCNI